MLHFSYRVVFPRWRENGGFRKNFAHVRCSEITVVDGFRLDTVINRVFRPNVEMTTINQRAPVGPSSLTHSLLHWQRRVVLFDPFQPKGQIGWPVMSERKMAAALCERI